jgi:molybdopterin molybdotransferase
MTAPPTLREISCADDYDPNSMPVDRARALIRQFLTPVTGTERMHIRQALDRVIAEDLTSPIAVPGHDNSAMDGWAVRFADFPPAAIPSFGASVNRSRASRRRAPSVPARPCASSRRRHARECGHGGDAGARERARRSRAHRRRRRAQGGQNRRFAGEDMRRGQVVLRRGQPIRPAELGMIASLGINEVTVFRRLRVAFFSTGDELRSIGTTLGPGEIYDSNRYTLFGCCRGFRCDALDMGVVPDVPDALEEAFATAAANADVVITPAACRSAKPTT